MPVVLTVTHGQLAHERVVDDSNNKTSIRVVCRGANVYLEFGHDVGGSKCQANLSTGREDASDLRSHGLWGC